MFYHGYIISLSILWRIEFGSWKQGLPSLVIFGSKNKVRVAAIALFVSNSMNERIENL